MIPGPDNDFPLVLCHNDPLENNLLMKMNSNLNLLLIDYEYSGWNPMAMDLADYWSETMVQNSYPEPNGLKLYFDNIMTDDEVKIFTKEYLKVYFQKYAKDDVK